MDAETAKLIEELAEDEVENAGDLRKYKADLNAAAIRRLARRAAATRASRARCRTKRKIAQQQKAAVKGKMLAKMRSKIQNAGNVCIYIYMYKRSAASPSDVFKRKPVHIQI